MDRRAVRPGGKETAASYDHNRLNLFREEMSGSLGFPAVHTITRQPERDGDTGGAAFSAA
jgi:hypothetical protein